MDRFSSLTGLINSMILGGKMSRGVQLVVVLDPRSRVVSYADTHLAHGRDCVTRECLRRRLLLIWGPTQPTAKVKVKRVFV